MGVRTLVGIADGTTPAAAMFDSVTGTMFGPIFEGERAVDEIGYFQDWLTQRKFIALVDEIGLETHDIPNPGKYDGSDARQWPDNGLKKLVAYWRKNVLAA